MRVNYVNPYHVHSLIDLPAYIAIVDPFQLYKGSSSSWINKQVSHKFNWSIGYGAFSVSESNLDKVVKYIMNQEEQHSKMSYVEEYEKFFGKHNAILNR